MIPKLNIIGCGRLGKTVGFLLNKAGAVRVQDILNTTTESAQQAVSFIGKGTPCSSIENLRPADIYLIAATDQQIPSVCKKLMDKHKLRPGNIVFHCSGSLSADVLKSAAAQGCYTASLHFIKSFPRPELGIKSFKGTFCAFEGDPRAFDTLAYLVEKIGGVIFTIGSEEKMLYHAAGIFASVYVTALSYIAVESYKKTGVSETMAKQIVNRIMSDTLANIHALGSHQKAIVGPIERGDIETTLKHIATLKRYPLLLNLYKILGQCALLLSEPTPKLKKDFSKMLEFKK